ncbi:glycosyltransferase family 4 protein [candidate division FCPU426 bacterium]|nr:glycosyltransferase family 4 protein [candidate division FCPU426 bacterium]
MKIAMLTSWEQPCGIADYARALVKSLEPLLTVKVVPIDRGQKQAAYFRHLGQAGNDCDLVHIQHEYIFFGGRDPWNYYWPDILREIRVPLVVTSHTWLTAFSGGPIWKRTLRSMRDALYGWLGWNQYLETGQFKQARRLIVHSRAHAQFLQGRGFPPEKLAVVAQGVPVHFPPGDALCARSRWGLKGPVVAIFGFLIPSKGHLLALQAWRTVLPEATLMIVGKPFSKTDAAYAEIVAKQARFFGRAVRLTGYLETPELADLLAATDLVIMPYTSSTSSYSLSVLLAQRKAVLASDLSCFKEVQTECPCLELFPAGDSLALARKINTLLRDPQQLSALSQAAGVWAGNHSWDKIASRLVKVYTEAMD